MNGFKNRMGGWVMAMAMLVGCAHLVLDRCAPESSQTQASISTETR